MKRVNEKKTSKIRLDELLVKKGFFESRTRAKAEIMEGNVFVNGIKVDKAGTMIKMDSRIEIKKKLEYVSRGALKLEYALKKWNINVKDKVCLDIGSSTGGFVEVFLKNNAKKVYAVDVNIKQLHYKLYNDKRVIKIEKNARYLRREDLEELPDIISIDVSFISAHKILEPLKKINIDASIILLIKPQFEGEKKDVKKGIVKDKRVLLKIVENFLKKLSSEFNPVELIESPIKGQKGNREFLLLIDNKSPKRYNMDCIKEVVFGKN